MYFMGRNIAYIYRVTADFYSIFPEELEPLEINIFHEALAAVFRCSPGAASTGLVGGEVDVVRQRVEGIFSFTAGRHPAYMRQLPPAENTKCYSPGVQASSGSLPDPAVVLRLTELVFVTNLIDRLALAPLHHDDSFGLGTPFSVFRGYFPLVTSHFIPFFTPLS